ncbi:hypothetical protein TraAM80_05653 [Trypanosoma rangeli]|uniref:Uncharacterized protein n=1 Tax=Trypanosoma rangeli TaxID=5698 RepID=A0A422NDR1_TRYRA|nr:uncharacterized protein TraAM80_05653 [Trypanosoma rangeli]RNF03611.1 hypothetical protein TraAM80_05653 [Trypanosoma rangeli]|eukprot:RNF03611.1 hypothetical protein TraAM80_05653 [Trypanosoma rangeli]
MKVKKKDLRKGEAQLPINYPQPEVADGVAIDHTTDFDAEKTRVEALCKRLAHNEVAVRDAVLAELPRYIQGVTRRLVGIEADVDVAALRRFITMRGGDHTHGDDADGETRTVVNVLRELETYRDHVGNVRREQRRQADLQCVQQQRQPTAGDGDVEGNKSHGNDNQRSGAEEVGEARLSVAAAAEPVSRDAGRKSLRQIYGEWISVWCEVELLLLKLSRGVFFCLWHSDKPLVQLECAQRIARLIHAPHTNSGKILLFSCLMRVLVREWRSMDRYRADKFLALVRKMIYELACLLKSLEAETRSQQRGVGGGEERETRTPSGKADRAAPVRKRASMTGGMKRRRGEGYDTDVLTHDPLCRALHEACYVFQGQIVPEPTAVGLTMHVCDVLFDELCRAALSPVLFLALSDRIALYAMSQGNYVEKRVLDYFIAPIAGGLLASRRQEHQQERRGLTASTGAAAKRRRPHDEEEVADNDKDSRDAGAGDNTAAHAKAEAETRGMLLQLADCCRAYSVAWRTVRPVRVMFTESEMVLRQAADPDAYKPLTGGELRRRIEQEVADVEETQHAVVEERRRLRLLRQQEKKQMPQRLRKRHVAAADDGDEDDGDAEADATRQQLNNKMKTKKKLHSRNTKRKKHYTLTREDLYGEE